MGWSYAWLWTNNSLTKGQSVIRRTPLEYCWVEQNKTLYIVMSLARRDHRKSKFGLRHDISLILLYVMTKSKFWFSMIPPSNRDRNVRLWLDPVVVPSNPRGRAAGMPCIIFSRKFTRSRARALPGFYEPISYYSTRQYEYKGSALQTRAAY